MPQGPYLLSGTIYTSRGTVSNSRVIINSDLAVLTDSSGQYVADLANMDSGYTVDATYTITARDEFDNEFVSDTITVSGQNQTKNLFLEPRTNNNNMTKNASTQHISMFNLGDQPISEENLLPVKTLEKPMTQKLAYSGSNVEYVGEAAPGTPVTESRWRIKKLLYSGSNVTDTVWAKGNAEFDKVWNNRAGYGYS